jgi:single-strand DNA-binding protein
MKKQEQQMSTTNYVNLEGFVTQEPLLKKTKSGKSLCTFAISMTHDSPSKEQHVSFLDIETWEKMAESCAERVKKGKRVIVTGQIRQERWQAADGSPRSKIKLVGNKVQYLMSLKDEEVIEKQNAA